LPQSAQDYVKAQQIKHPPRRPTEQQIRDLAAGYGLNPDEVLRNYQEKDYAHRLFEIIVPGLPTSVADLLDKGQIAVGEIGQHSANAYLRVLPDGQYAVLFHSGLAELLYRVARPVSMVLTKDSKDDSEGLTVPELARVIAEIFWWYQESEIAFGPSHETGRCQVLLANAIATYAEAFLLAHEFGHIYATQSSDWRYGAGETHSLDSLEEHLADMTGLLTLLKSVEEGHGPYPRELPVAYAGAELALQIWHVMSQLGVSFVDGDHPPADERIEGLRVVLRQHCSADSDYDAVISFAKGIEKIFSEVVEIVRDPREHRLHYERAADRLVINLRALVSRCTGGIFPDYATFYQEAPRLLDEGYPEVVVERVVSQVAKEFKAAVKLLPQEERKSLDREWTETERQAMRQCQGHFQAFKLFLGLTQYLAEPVAGIYQAVLDREMKSIEED
jgi:hypothetical protein